MEELLIRNYRFYIAYVPLPLLILPYSYLIPILLFFSLSYLFILLVLLVSPCRTQFKIIFASLRFTSVVLTLDPHRPNTLSAYRLSGMFWSLTLSDV